MNGSVLKIFNEIDKIPRSSGNEIEISNYVLNFAINLGLVATRDEYNNVKVKKSAQGMKGETIILQSHMDMVCVSEENSTHNFDIDPIEILEEDGWITGKGTTLGADNGIGMAIMLAIMESKDVIHPDLEFIFTTDEERGLTGAANIALDDFNGKRLINLDGEEEGIFYVSCAGSMRAVLSKDVDLIEMNNKFRATKSIRLFNGNGGHSGLDIQKQNINAIQLMSRILKYIDSDDLYLHDFNGGGKENSIPTSTTILISIPCEIEVKVIEKLKEIMHIIKLEYPNEEKIEISVENASDCKFAMSKIDKESLLNLLLTIPNGTQKINLNTGEASLSNNIGTLRFDNNKIVITNLLRSNEDSTKIVLLDKINILARSFDFNLSTYGDYQAWEYIYNSDLQKEIKKLYENSFGRQAQFHSIHAGLECAYFSKKRPEWDMISMGCNIENAHTTRERLEIASVYRVYNFLLKLIKDI
jgi:dipeptidase D